MELSPVTNGPLTCAAAVFVAVSALAEAAAAGDAAMPDTGPVAFTLAPTDQAPGLASHARIDLKLPVASVTVQAQASVGGDSADTNLWRKHGAAVSADIPAPAGTHVALTGSDDFALVYRDPSSLGDPDTATHIVRSNTRAAGLAWSAAPWSGAALELDAHGSQTQSQDISASAAPASERASVGTDSQEIAAKLAWSPLGWMALDAGAAAHSAGVEWQAVPARKPGVAPPLKQSHSARYTALDPHVGVTLTPWSGAQWSARLSHDVSPYDAAAFAVYAAAAGPSGSIAAAPDHAWHFESSVSQAVGPATVKADYAADRSGSVTEFGAAPNGAQAPVSTPLLDRSKFAFALSLPLTHFGMANTQLTSSADFQDSEVVDPVTHQTRRASGEVPRKFRVKLERDLPRQKLSLGLTGEYDDADTSYQLDSISAAAPGGRVGAFLAYKPGPFELDADVAAVYGSSTADTTYSHTRADPIDPRLVAQSAPGPTFSLSLKRTF